MRALLIFLSIIPALAQFSALTTTTDGSRLYFSSTLQLAGSADVSSDPKIFRYDGTHFYLYAHLAKATFTPPPIPAGQAALDSNYYALQAPFVSGNGAVTGYVGYADCLGCTYARVLPAQTTFQFAGAFGALVLPYACDVSTNGRYALCLTRMTPGNATPALLIDLFSLQQGPPLATLCWGNPHFMTTSGSVLLSSFNSLTLWSAASGTRDVGFIPPGAPYGTENCPMISNDGSVIVHVTNTALAIFNVATKTDTPLLAGQAINGTIYAPSLVTISDDARWILAGTYDGVSSQLAIIDSSSGSIRQLTFGLDQAQTATLSGDGTIAYAVTASGKLLKINTQSGVSQMIAGSQPVAASIDGAPVPGSLNRLMGSGLTSAQVMLNGASLPVILSTTTEVDFQIPWETPVGGATLQVIPAAPTAFQQLWPLQIQAFDPVAESQPIHQDFSGFINPSSPALGGEVVNYYFTGLGIVSPAAADGKPAGTNPLSLATTPLTLVGDAGQAAAKIVYAGLAPGTVGLYQVSIQLPPKINRTNPFLPGGPNLFSLTLNGIGLTVWALPD
jgi:uncharacterized protein (TIGR03437 family)